jgi:hypothetical protein
LELHREAGQAEQQGVGQQEDLLAVVEQPSWQPNDGEVDPFASHLEGVPCHIEGKGFVLDCSYKIRMGRNKASPDLVTES